MLLSNFAVFIVCMVKKVAAVIQLYSTYLYSIHILNPQHFVHIPTISTIFRSTQNTILTVNFFLFLLLRKLNLCSTGVKLKPLTRLLKACHTLEHLNLAGCRALPRPMKRLYSNREAIVQLNVDILAGKFNNCDDDDDDQTIAK